MAVAGSYSGANSYTRGQSPLARGSIHAFKASFFDREAVLKAMDKATAKVLSRHGSYVRRRAQTSIRYRADPSTPGEPPSGHRTMTRAKTNKRTGVTKIQDVSPLREWILFAYLAADKAVLIGPAKTNQRNAQGSGGKTIPEVLEYGGKVGLWEHLVPNMPAIYGRFAGQWIRTDLRYRLSQGGVRSAVGRPTRQRLARYEARPYMHPAQAAELPALMESFRNSL